MVVVLEHRSIWDRSNFVKKRFGDSFLPSVIKSWNDLPDDIRSSISLSKFKLTLKQTLLATDNVPPYYAHGDRFANICQTQLRLHHSGLHAHLFKINVIASSSCDCGHPVEDIIHFFLFCPLHAAPRLNLLKEIRDIVAPGVHSSLMVHVASERLVEILLYGNKDFTLEVNQQIFSSVQKFIINTRRFHF